MEDVSGVHVLNTSESWCSFGTDTSLCIGSSDLVAVHWQQNSCKFKAGALSKLGLPGNTVGHKEFSYPFTAALGRDD